MPDNLDHRRVDGRAHIIFIAYYPDPHLLKKALILGYDANVYKTLLAGCIREDVGVEEYFDQVYEYQDFSELHEIVSRSNAWSWHVASPIYHAAILINAGTNGSRLVVDVNDTALYLEKNSNHPSLEVEREVLRHADHLIHKMPKEAWDILQATYGLSCTSSTIMSYPLEKFCCNVRLKKANSPPHVVYAGGIMPYEIAVSRGHENHIFDDLINLTGSDSFELSIFVNRNARDMPWYQHKRYFDFDKTYPRFHFRKGQPYYAITNTLSRYDAGIFFDNILKSSYNPSHFKFNVASKFFTYLEAGLPVVVYDEAEFMADWVKRYNLGATYQAKKLESIVPAIKRVAANDYSENISKFCKTHSMDANQKVLMEAHGL
jgi:hypothetical protein